VAQLAGGTGACDSGRMTTGLLAAAAALALAAAIGLWRRRADGRLRPVGGARAPSPAVRAASAGGPSGASAGGPSGASAGRPSVASAGDRIDPALLAELGVQPSPATLLQFSSAFCAPCRAVRRISGEVADLVPGVRHVEVDAESHLDAVRTLGIWRTPTLLVLDAGGRVVRRATGVPGKAQLIAVLGDILPP
jgi:thiol-disulfide isomerase/thioredoxin